MGHILQITALITAELAITAYYRLPLESILYLIVLTVSLIILNTWVTAYIGNQKQKLEINSFIQSFDGTFPYRKLDLSDLLDAIPELRTERARKERNHLNTHPADWAIQKGTSHFLVYSSCPDAKNQKIARQLKAFSNSFRTIIFLPFELENLTGLEKFKILHELGHISYAGFAKASLTRKLDLLTASLIPLIGITRIDFELEIIIFFFTGISIYLSMQFFASNKRIINYQVVDEIYADNYAFSKSEPNWFENLDSEKLANGFCNMANVSESQKRIRKDIFINNLNDLRSGKKLHPPSINNLRTIRGLSEPNGSARSLTLLLISFLAASLLFTAIFKSAIPNYGNVFWLLAIDVFACILIAHYNLSLSKWQTSNFEK